MENNVSQQDSAVPRPASRRRTLGLAKIFLRQHLLFPACLLPPNIILLIVFGLASFFGDISVSPLIPYIITVILAAAAATGLSVQFKRFDGKYPAYVYRAVILSPLALNLAAAFAGFLFIRESVPFAVTMGAVNPGHSLMTLWLWLVVPDLIPSTLLLNQFVFCGVFLLFSFVRIKEEGKRPARRVTACAAAAVLVLTAALSAVMQYPELEYYNMKQRFKEIPFSEDVDDYIFYMHLPFAAQNDFASLDEESALCFDDSVTTPRIDGATAFYPLYCAFAQSTFTAVSNGVESLRQTDPYYQYETITYDYSGVFSQDFEGKIFCTKTDRAFRRLAEGKTDIIFAFEPSAEQLAYAQNAGISYKMTKIGYDAFCFFVSGQNPVDSLKLEDIRSIYAGKLTNWKNVGGPNKRILAFQRPEGSGSQTAMENLVMKDLKISTRYQANTVRTMGGMIRVIDSYLNTPTAIGYTFMYYSSSMVTGSQIKYIAVDGVMPDEDTVRRGAYPFTTPFYAITREGEETEETRAFVDWILGPQGKTLIEKTGYVSV